ncbi:8286_t:CDS:2, partial [Funneliformis geosporum]
KEDLIRCQLKVGPLTTILNLIIEINSGEFSQERLIPCIQDIQKSKWPYSRYFYTFSFEEWSLSHFEDWVLQNYKVPKREVYNRCFFKVIRRIKEDPRTLEEIREIISVLDKKYSLKNETKLFYWMGWGILMSGYPFLGIIYPSEGELRPQKLADPVHICWPRPGSTYLASLPSLKKSIRNSDDPIDKHYAYKSILQDYNEPGFQTAIELLLPTNHRRSEVRLIIDGLKKNSGTNENGIKSSVILELKCISLVGLLSGVKKRWVENAEYKSLKELDEELEKETEDELLGRKYFYWCKEGKKFKQIVVEELINNGMEQLGRYLKTMQKGKVSNNGSGICDDKIKIVKGKGYLGGVLVVSIAPNLSEFTYCLLSIPPNSATSEWQNQEVSQTLYEMEDNIYNEDNYVNNSDNIDDFMYSLN